jgi:hypothetical protein
MPDTKVSAPAATATAPAPAEYRKLIVEVLAESDGGLPIRDVERIVGERLPEGARDSIEDEVQSLIDWDLVVRDRSKKLKLTDAGVGFWKGIQALTNP